MYTYKIGWIYLIKNSSIISLVFFITQVLLKNQADEPLFMGNIGILKNGSGVWVKLIQYYFFGVKLNIRLNGNF